MNGSRTPLRRYHWPCEANTAHFCLSLTFDVRQGGRPEGKNDKKERSGGKGRPAQLAFGALSESET